MCTAVGKYIKGKGWVIAKNRDQDYVSETSFLDKRDPKVGEILLLDDRDIDYNEGMNHNPGMVVITTSLTPKLSLETNKKDGEIIVKALHMSDPEEAAKFVISKKLTGFIFIATAEKFVLVEAARKNNGDGKYQATYRVVPKTETVVRTNHGIEFPWAGFQYGVDKKQDIWRKSSETRKSIAEKTLKKANSPEEMLDALAVKSASDLQMNVFRVENKPRQMRTIFQWALAPKESMVYLRPIQTRMNVKVTHEKISIEVLDNEPIKKIYDGTIKHFCKLEVSKDERYIKTVQTEQFLTFRNFIKFGAPGGT